MTTLEYGPNIQHQREQLGLTRDTLATGLQVHPATVANWETGKSTPRPAMRVRIQALLDYHRSVAGPPTSELDLHHRATEALRAAKRGVEAALELYS